MSYNPFDEPSNPFDAPESSNPFEEQIQRNDPLPAYAPSKTLNLGDVFHLETESMIENTGQSIVDVAISGPIFVVAFSDVFYRSNLENKRDFDVINLKGEAIRKVFLDPTGHHLLVNTKSKNVYYLHSSENMPKEMGRLRGFDIGSLCWDYRGDHQATKLLFSVEAELYETDLQDKECKQRIGISFNIPKVKKLLRLDDESGEQETITGIHFEWQEAISAYYSIITTQSTIRVFSECRTLDELFKHPNLKSVIPPLPGTKLRILRETIAASYFAWGTNPGILHSKLVPTKSRAAEIVPNRQDILYIDNFNDSIDFALTKFHLIVIFPDKVKAISLITEEVVFEENLYTTNDDRVLGIAYDNFSFFIFTTQNVYHLDIENESQHVWFLYMKKGDYKSAISYANTTDQKQKIFVKQADQYFEEQNYAKAAEMYARSKKPFEEVVLSFIHAGQQDALIFYLQKKLETMEPLDEKYKTTQKFIICTWLVELYINRCNDLESAGYLDDAAELSEGFEEFCGRFKQYLDSKTTIKLLQSHGRTKELLSFCKIKGEYETCVQHFIQQKKWIDALESLNCVDDDDLFYNYCPILMENAPKKTVEILNNNPQLSVSKLLPTLMRYNPPVGLDISEHYAISYLYFQIYKCNNKERSVHNFLLSLYVKYNYDDRLLNLIEKPDTYFEMEYALMLCTKHGKKKACISIYAKMQLFEEAIDLALEIDVDLAKHFANEPRDEDERKKLWLRIARHVVEEKQDISKAMEFLKTCPLLKIKDILGFFPDFVQIHQFKKEITDSLIEHNEKMDELKAEMQRSTEAAEVIRQELESQRTKYRYVDTKQSCEICGYPILTNTFYLFPCQHVFHFMCLARSVASSLPELKGEELLMKIQSYLRTEEEMEAHKASGSTDTIYEEMLKQYKQDLDNIVAYECFLCGDGMVESITNPFVKPQQKDNSWDIANDDLDEY